MESHVVSICNNISSSPKIKTNWKSIYIVAIVAFISSLEFAASNDWNYFCQLDSSATITFYGILRTVGGLSGGISTLLAGWLCNKLKNTRQILILSKLLIFVATGFFLGAELVNGFLFYAFFLCYKLFMGIAIGGGSMSKTHVAMASTEEDRDKAIALTTLLPSVGLLFGFLINVLTSYMKYPGIEIPLIKIHLNLFTTPMIFSMLIFLLALYLLLYHFDGKWHIYENMKKIKNNKIIINGKEEINNKKEENVHSWITKIQKLKQQKNKNKNAKINYCFDWIAVLICCYTQLVISLVMLNLMTISSPYQQLAFQWNSSKLQFYGGLIGAAVAFQLILWPAFYMFFGLNKIISERISIIFGLIILIFGYLFTYSWPFLSETFPYALNNNNNISFLNIEQQINISNCGSQSHPGCPLHYDWCKTTTKPNILVYISSFVLSTGMAIPILRMNLDILYSKILGNIKQGVMQGFFVVCQGIIEIIGGSIAVSWVFEKSGPKHIWEFIGSQLILCLLCWIIFYKRMISKNQNKWLII